MLLISPDKLSILTAAFICNLAGTFEPTHQQPGSENDLGLIVYWMVSIRMTIRQLNHYFYDQQYQIISGIIPEGAAICHVGYDSPWLLTQLKPAHSRGVRISDNIFSNEKFDYIVVTSLGYVPDIQELFLSLKPLLHSRTKVILLNYNFLWEPVFKLAEKIGLRRPQPPQGQNMIPTHQVVNLLRLTNFQEVKWSSHVLVPIYIPVISNVFNRFLAPHFPFRYFSSTDVIVARPLIKPDRPICCSVIVPCKNEKGNIELLFKRIPKLADGTEMILIDDRSTDGTKEEMERCARLYTDLKIRIIEGPGICKAEAVRVACKQASGDIIAILDADLAVMPEELPKCIQPLLDGTADFVNTVRFVYPQEGRAMRWLNIVGNRVFAMIFTVLLRQRIGDTLSGTKVFWKKDYENIDRLKTHWIWRDQWGDFEQLLGASKLGLKIADIPVHYAERTYGDTKMKNRFKNGIHMLKLCLGGLIRLRFD